LKAAARVGKFSVLANWGALIDWHLQNHALPTFQMVALISGHKWLCMVIRMLLMA
jgi:hypothetical protein